MTNNDIVVLKHNAAKQELGSKFIVLTKLELFNSDVVTLTGILNG